MNLTFLLITFAVSVLANNHLTNKRTKKVLARNPDQWHFADNCVGPRCSCWSDGCWQQITSCFGMRCLGWQCYGANCGCPSGQCVRACIGDGCVLEVVTIEDAHNSVPGDWVWTEELKHHRSSHRKHH